MEYKKERLSKDPYCCKYKDKRNILSLDVTDEKVYMIEEKLCQN